MAPLEPPLEALAPITPVGPEAETLFKLQLLVARRADVLARRSLPSSRDVDRRVWLKAELDIFERGFA